MLQDSTSSRSPSPLYGLYHSRRQVHSWERPPLRPSPEPQSSGKWVELNQPVQGKAERLQPTPKRPVQKHTAELRHSQCRERAQDRDHHLKGSSNKPTAATVPQASAGRGRKTAAIT